ncbi:hypothetical protein W97_06580 [Coniosporium apollinis CBS 100218]|uniref:Uncharacterized protein n=1 Tax=Coniosporium apollinis (strain CBS 100218) TaxID=1168221 RepID=R7YZJ3_CONA1|nr:uncharacterized protein W97_06580 [Coniosporium apollinis CBS 100218]EON67327.1 hypothetical protein W97_06580 [Coniosporium apollinis CBS 100218]
MLFRSFFRRVRLTFQDLVGSGPSTTPNEGGEATASCDSLRQLYESAVASSSAYGHETPRVKSEDSGNERVAAPFPPLCHTNLPRHHASDLLPRTLEHHCSNLSLSESLQRRILAPSPSPSKPSSLHSPSLSDSSVPHITLPPIPLTYQVRPLSDDTLCPPESSSSGHGHGPFRQIRTRSRGPVYVFEPSRFDPSFQVRPKHESAETIIDLEAQAPTSFSERFDDGWTHHPDEERDLKYTLILLAVLAIIIIVLVAATLISGN